MTTWETLRTEIREDIEDTGSTKRYSDALLWTYLKDAIKDYSTWFPLRVDKEVLSGSGAGPYPEPVGLVNILFVECPDNRFLERRLASPGARYPKTSGRPFFFYMDGGNLYLDGSPLAGESVLMTYESLHDWPSSSDDDDSHVFSLPEGDEELIRLYVKAKIFEKVRTKTANLDRFAETGRTENPVTPEVRNLMRDYDRKIAARYQGGSIMLHRQGRIR
jgi:hypothetical protein